jgi:hypothetical protein
MNNKLLTGVLCFGSHIYNQAARIRVKKVVIKYLALSSQLQNWYHHLTKNKINMMPPNVCVDSLIIYKTCWKLSFQRDFFCSEFYSEGFEKSLNAYFWEIQKWLLLLDLLISILALKSYSLYSVTHENPSTSLKLLLFGLLVTLK